MKAMILAAGRGERMRPLTDATPKPLLEVGGKPLIGHHLMALKKAGFAEVVINLSHLGEQIRAALGDGLDYGLNITYSEEGEPPLETAGAIVQALSRLNDAPFLVINGDVFTDYPLERLHGMQPSGLAHLVLVPNPEQNPEGDFALENDRIRNDGPKRHTFAGIAVYRPEMFADLEPGARPLTPLLRTSADRDQVTGELYGGIWFDIGTPERLAALDAKLRTED
jgi:MurNAc alpha-1-phosphate uridylyltransferase